MHTGHPVASITTQNSAVIDCFAVEFTNAPISERLLQLAESWLVYDPFRCFWIPEREGSADGINDLGDDLTSLDAGYSWLNSVVLFDSRSADLGILRSMRTPNGQARPDWALRYDFFLMNYVWLRKVADLAVFPSLWAPDHTDGNFVALCADSDDLRKIAENSVVTPILPAAVLRAWPEKMFNYIKLGVGLTGENLGVRKSGFP